MKPDYEKAANSVAQAVINEWAKKFFMIDPEDEESDMEAISKAVNPVISEAIRRAVEEETERCAKVAESLRDEIDDREGEICIAYKLIAAAIRQREGKDG